MENISLPTIDQGQYDRESNHNDQKAIDIFSQIFPEALVPYQYVFEIIDFLQQTKVNAQVLPQIIRGIHNLVIGTGRGQVIIHVNNETMNVQIREQGEDISTKL
jgi:hypothetical protein